MKAVFVGGPFDNIWADLDRVLPTVLVCGQPYDAITDPDTGEWLGGYAVRVSPTYPGDSR